MGERDTRAEGYRKDCCAFDHFVTDIAREPPDSSTVEPCWSVISAWIPPSFVLTTRAVQLIIVRV
jgi:hypothetical protein